MTTKELKYNTRKFSNRRRARDNR